MNGFTTQSLDDDAFGAKKDVGSNLRTFDAFPKTKPTYTAPSRRGGQFTVLTLLFCIVLAWSELKTWWQGKEYHHFGVEKGVGRIMQVNLDMVLKMPCDDVTLDVRDAAGDSIFGEGLLSKEPTNWDAWRRVVHEYQVLHQEETQRLLQQEEDQHVGHVLGEIRGNWKRKFPKGPRLGRSDHKDSCRIFGSIEGNKVQGEIFVHARGHGNADAFWGGGAADRRNFNWSHLITELSFGPHYGTLMNPLDKTVTTTDEKLHKYQYYLSVVPTIYTKSKIVDPYTAALPDPSTITSSQRKNTVFTNQYAVTSHSQVLEPTFFAMPGIFFRYNIEPILLVVSEERGSLLALLVRLVNVASGVIVSGGWLFQLSTWVMESAKKRRSRSRSAGVLTGMHSYSRDD